ncbi:MAG: CYTH domain-containing protein [Leptolyngbya sp. SIO1D8]|nr:CYTH domain-containing protein [Leptolyngbya sp. SIO1D8]
MAQEIERKFLVVDSSWRHEATRKLYRQGYIPTQNKTTVRVRIAGDRGYLTVKGASTGITRLEFEYEIPSADAGNMLNSLCIPPLIEKWRYQLTVGNHLWEIDEFLGENAGLVLAEVELASEIESFVLPAWVGEEVSHDPRYYNANLARFPYRSWQTS